MRDANGRAKVAAPSASDDIARKAEVDAVLSALNTHMDATSIGIHGAMSLAVPNRLIIRDSDGRASVADPTSASDIATKGYVDGHVIDYVNDYVVGLVGSLRAGTVYAYYLTPPNEERPSSNTSYPDLWVQDMDRNVIVHILLPGTIRYYLQYRASGTGACYVRILQNGSQIRQESTTSNDWQTVTDNITVSSGDIITIQKRTSSSSNPVYWRNVRIETLNPPLGIQRF